MVIALESSRPKSEATLGMSYLAATVAACFLFVLCMVLPTPSQAQRLDTNTLALFPKGVAEFGYANLKKARSIKWYPQLQNQLLPERFRQFEKFMAGAGVDPNTQVDELAWGLIPEGMTAKSEGTGSDAVPSGEEVVGVALGTYNLNSTEAYFKQQKLPAFKSHGYNLYAFGTGAGANDLFFLFIDSSTAAFGHRSLLEKMIDVRFGGQESLLRNDTMFSLINEANGGGSVVWAVLNPAYTRLAIRQLAPEIEQFPEAAKLVKRLQNTIINVDASNGVDAKVQAVCGSTDDANLLAQLMQAGFLYKRYQAGKDDPELAALLDQARVSPAGDRVTLGMSLTDEQVTGLIKHNTFALKM
jgi:hypothetical protein